LVYGTILSIASTHILPLIDEVLGDTLDARMVIRGQALLTCWTVVRGKMGLGENGSF
jgi:hypothetical protein